MKIKLPLVTGPLLRVTIPFSECNSDDESAGAQPEDHKSTVRQHTANNERIPDSPEKAEGSTAIYFDLAATEPLTETRLVACLHLIRSHSIWLERTNQKVSDVGVAEVQVDEVKSTTPSLIAR